MLEYLTPQAVVNAIGVDRSVPEPVFGYVIPRRIGIDEYTYELWARIDEGDVLLYIKAYNKDYRYRIWLQVLGTPVWIHCTPRSPNLIVVYEDTSEWEVVLADVVRDADKDSVCSYTPRPQITYLKRPIILPALSEILNL